MTFFILVFGECHANHQIIKSSKSSVRTFARLSSALTLGVWLAGQVTLAAPFSYEYSDTLDVGTTISGLSAGQPAKITVTLDNGGATRNSQTWTSTHLKAVTWSFNNGTVLTTFCTPFGGGLDGTTGNFVSDGSGNLTSVMTDWNDDIGGIGADFITNSAGTPNAWYLNGGGSVYGENGWLLQARLTNVANMTTASNWTTSTLIGSCTPSTPVSAPIDFSFNHKQVETFATEIELK